MEMTKEGAAEADSKIFSAVKSYWLAHVKDSTPMKMGEHVLHFRYKKPGRTRAGSEQPGAQRHVDGRAAVAHDETERDAHHRPRSTGAIGERGQQTRGRNAEVADWRTGSSRLAELVRSGVLPASVMQPNHLQSYASPSLPS
eukprot:8062380-Pyramimonas_sp.AAC.1